MDIINSLPESAEITVDKLEGVFTDDCIINIVSAPNPEAANKMILNYLIINNNYLNTSNDLLSLINQLEKITESPNLVAIVAELKAGLYCLIIIKFIALVITCLLYACKMFTWKKCLDIIKYSSTMAS